MGEPRHVKQLPKMSTMLGWGVLTTVLLMTLMFAPAQTDASEPWITIDWSYVEEQPYYVLEGQGEAVNGKLYYFGGYDRTLPDYWIPAVRAFEYDPVADTFTRIADMPDGGLTHSGTATDGQYIYLAGGYPPRDNDPLRQAFSTADVWRYDPVSDSYTSMPSLPEARGAGALEYVNGYLHFIGGTSGFSANERIEENEHWRLNLNGGTQWERMADLPLGRNHSGSVVIGDYILYIGGQVGQDGPADGKRDIQAYHIPTDTWEQRSQLPDSPRHHITESVVELEGRAIIIGGESAWKNGLSSVIAYDLATDTFEDLGDLPNPSGTGNQPQMSGVAVLIDGTLYYTGGASKYTFRGDISGLTPAPALDVSMTASATNVNSNTQVTFTITVSNNGDLDIPSVLLSDSPIAACNTTISNLIVGTTQTHTCSTTITAPLTNIITATATVGDQIAIDSALINITVNPGMLTIVKNAMPNSDQAFTFVGSNGIGNFSLTDDGSTESFVNATINFQPEATTPPVGYTSDVGRGFSELRGYGWITQESINNGSVAIDARSNTRDRARAGVPAERDTIIHMQYTGNNGINTPIAWEYALPDGQYTVTVSVGDEPNGQDIYDSSHVINIEGQPLVENFISTQQEEYREFTGAFYVSDGRLTLDAIGGNNTKINYVIIQGNPAPSSTEIFAYLQPGAYTITENAVEGWSFAGATCNGTTPQLNGSSLTVNIVSGANVVCTFTNTEDVVIPPTIQQTAPLGTVDSGMGDPDYTWGDVGATAYELYINRTDGTVIYNAQIDAGDLCSNDVCTFDPTTLGEAYRLYNGSYQWYVRDIEVATWSGPANFTIDVPKPLLPENVTVENADTLYPTFNWTVNPNTNANSATYFNVVVQEEGVTVLNQWHTREAVCGSMTGTTCALMSTVELEDQKNHTVTLASYGIGGVSDGTTTPVAFLINVPRPEPISPNGVVELPFGNPVYTWTDMPDTPYFYIYVADAMGAPIINEVISDIGYCNGTQCQFDATTISEAYRLSPGTYDFFVRGWREGSPTPWSSPMNFTVTATPPTFVTKLTPEAGSAEAGPQVTFSWNAVADALWYELPVVAPNGTVLTNTVMVGEDITCENNTCELTLTLPAIYGTWSWYLQAVNVGGAGAWSEGEAADGYGVWTFTMPVEIPGAITKLTPNTTLDNAEVTFEWEADDAASLYELYVVGPNGYVLYESYQVGTDVTCDTTCSQTRTMPTNGAYTWYVRAGSLAGTSPWMTENDPNGGAMAFSINVTLPEVIELVSPAAQDVLDTFDITLDWKHDVAARDYEVYIVGPNGYVLYESYEVGADVTCDTNCEKSVTVPANGAYTWYVRGGNAAGMGPWLPQGVTTGVTFTVNAAVPGIPGVIQNPSPAVGATLTDVDMSFSWTADAEATVYELYIAGPEGFVHYQGYTANELTCGATCSLNFFLPGNGAFTWYVRGGSDTGWGPWIGTGVAPFTFTLDAPLPDIINLTNPVRNAVVDSLEVDFTWASDPNAIFYEVYITGPNNYVFHEQFDSGAVCNTNCALPQSLPVDGAYAWYVRGGNNAGWGEWGTGATITVDEPTLPLVNKQAPAQDATVTDVNVAFTWNAVPTATVYDLYVTGPEGYVHSASYTVGTGVTCNGTCTVNLTLPANGDYVWYMRAGNSNGYGAWGADDAGGDYGGVGFTVNMPLPAAPTLVSPQQDGIIYQTNRPTFTWNTVNTALWYNLEVTDGMGNITFTQWVEAVNVCANGVCSYQLPNPILYGGYSWRVQAYNPAGVGAWSTARNFLSLSINLQPMMVQVEDTRITRSGTWTTQSSGDAMGRIYLQSTTSVNDTLTMRFSGTAVDVVYVAGPAYGTFVVEIDGQPLRGINANAGQVAFGQVASFSGLSEGEHTLRIVPLGGAPVAIDALVVDGQVLTATQPAPAEPTPIVIDPVETQPVETQPVETETPVVDDPVDSQPVETEPVETETPPAESTEDAG